MKVSIKVIQILNRALLVDFFPYDSVLHQVKQGLRDLFGGLGVGEALFKYLIISKFVPILSLIFGNLETFELTQHFHCNPKSNTLVGTDILYLRMCLLLNID